MITTRNYFDGQEDIEAVTWASSTETQTRRSIYGDTIDELLEHTDYAGPTAYYAHADKLGSIMMLVDASGVIAESYRYSDYGDTLVVDSSFAKLTTISSNINNWKRYTARERALPARLGDDWYFYRARLYRANTGRCVQRDALGYHNWPNLYDYVKSRPVNYVDPMGLDGITSMSGTATFSSTGVSINVTISPTDQTLERSTHVAGVGWLTPMMELTAPRGRRDRNQGADHSRLHEYLSRRPRDASDGRETIALASDPLGACKANCMDTCENDPPQNCITMAMNWTITHPGASFSNAIRRCCEIACAFICDPGPEFLAWTKGIRPAKDKGKLK